MNRVVTVNLKDPEFTSNTYTSREGGIYFVALSMDNDNSEKSDDLFIESWL